MGDLPVVATVVTAFLVTSVLGLWLVPYLKKIKYGQTILDIGPKWHKGKQGTPTMGGIMFAVGITSAVIVGFVLLATGAGGVSYELDITGSLRLLIGIVMALAFGFVGFVDDYIKVVKKRNLGLSERQKLIMQFLIAGLYIMGLYLSGDTSTIVAIPFLGQLQMGIWFYPLAIVGIVFLNNSVNLNDGVDGLCTSVTFVTALGFMAIAGILHMRQMSILAAALAGGCIGFLVWNLHPAKVFMGDTGSLFFGGCVIALAFGLGIPVYLAFMGIIYIIEGLSVMIQTAYFKLTRKIYGQGRRIFKMSPIHHHFEMCGWSEGKIVVVFSFVQFIFCALSVLAALRM